MSENPFPDYTPPDNVRVLYKTGVTFDSYVICDYIWHDLNNFLIKHGLGNNKATLLIF